MMTKHACVNTCLPVNIPSMVVSGLIWAQTSVRLGRVLRGTFWSCVSATSIFCYNNNISVFVARYSRAGSRLNLIMVEVSIFVVPAFKMRNFSTFSPIVCWGYNAREHYSLKVKVFNVSNISIWHLEVQERSTPTIIRLLNLIVYAIVCFSCSLYSIIIKILLSVV